MASPNPFYFREGSTVKAVEDLTSNDYDGVILVTLPDSYNLKFPSSIQSRVDSATLLDKGLKTEVAVVGCPEISGSRLIISPTGPITPYDDVRSLYEAAKEGVKRAIKAGVLNPILVIQQVPGFKESELVTLLGVLEGLYVPLQVRDSGKLMKINKLGIYGHNLTRNISDIIKKALYLEEARTVTRDIGGGDPERMCPPNVETYVRQAFHQSENIQLKVESDLSYLQKEYPLFAAVNRAANEIERHRGRVIFLEYTPADPSKVTDTVMLVGKGVTYDTGGADIKAGGVMAGMSRDKCGAAAVAGFMKACEAFSPAHLRVIGVMSMVRNSVGENSYVSDELIVARSGIRVRVGNTDAEGRMIMADLLCLMRDRARKEVNPHIYSVATLTGHAIRAMGEGYGIVIDNHAARLEGHSARLQESGDRMGDPFEISNLRREDLKAHRGTFEGDDALQANNKPSVNTERGHQNPAGFLLIASGLEGEQVKYSHLDVAGSAGSAPAEPTASPLLALAHHYKLMN